MIAKQALSRNHESPARRLLDTRPESIAEVPVASNAIFADFDTPAALSSLKSA